MAKNIDPVDEIEAKIAELQRQKSEVLEARRAADAQKRFEEANTIIPELVKILERLGEIGYVPPRLNVALSTKKGDFKPGQYIKRYRVPLKYGEVPMDEESTHT